MKNATANAGKILRKRLASLTCMFVMASMPALTLMAQGPQTQTAAVIAPVAAKAALPVLTPGNGMINGAVAGPWTVTAPVGTATPMLVSNPVPSGIETPSTPATNAAAHGETATPTAASRTVAPAMPTTPTAIATPTPTPVNGTATGMVKGGAAQGGGAPDGSEPLHLLLGRSVVITSQARVTRVSVADPGILDAMVVNPTEVLINGKAPGVCSLVLWDENGQNHTYDVYVDLDLRSLSQELKNTFPHEDVRAEAENDSVVLMGQATTQAVADKMLEIAKAVAPKAVSVIQVPTPTTAEILLQVKFAEVDTGAIMQLGLNILSLPGAKNVGSISTQQYGGPQLPSGSPLSPSTSGTSGFQLSNLLNIFYFRPDIDLGLTIQALQQKNVLEILAEPNVLTQSGKDASFLSGGEFPYPVVQGTGSGLPTVSIQFKEYGVRLDFTPTVMSDGIIHLKVRPEVSSLDYTNAVTLDGFTVPALSTRRVEAEMDLRDGQSFAIAGLINNQITDQLEKIPGLGDIPLFGKLFQSRNLNKSKNELLILVTPRIVEPLAVNAKLPEGPNYPIPVLPLAPPPKNAPAKPN